VVTVITAIVFSRDRAAQLDLLLTSLQQLAPELFRPLSVIWRATEIGFRDGYGICAHEHPEAQFVEEKDLVGQVRVLVSEGQFVTFFTDDDVLFRTAGEPERLLAKHDAAICFSLRLGMNTTHCYPLRRRQERPQFAQRDGVLVWDWESADGDFGYPGSLDGHVFRAATVRSLVESASYWNPNWLEDALMGGMRSIGKPLMACYPESCLVSVPANKVTESHLGNRNGEEHPVTTSELQSRYVSGERIDLAAMDFGPVCGAHHELPYVFV